MKQFTEVIKSFEDYELIKMVVAYADGYNCFGEDEFLFNMDSIIKELMNRED